MADHGHLLRHPVWAWTAKEQVRYALLRLGAWVAAFDGAVLVWAWLQGDLRPLFLAALVTAFGLPFVAVGYCLPPASCQGDFGKLTDWVKDRS